MGKAVAVWWCPQKGDDREAEATCAHDPEENIPVGPLWVLHRYRSLALETSQGL